LRTLLRYLARLVKWAIFAVILIEILSFLAISISNIIVYGHMREGSRAVYDPYTLFLQSAGVRATSYNEESPDAGKNRVIWIFGGSTMRGSTDHDDRTIASFLAQKLNGRQKDLKFTVCNFGVSSFNSLLEVKYLQKALIENSRKPDIVIFYDGANECKYFAEHRTAYGHHGYRRVKALIESYYASWFGLLKPLNAAVYASFTKELYDKINQVAVPLDGNDASLKGMVDLTEKRYDFVDKIVRCYGAEFLLIWQPLIWVEQCNVSKEVKEQEKSFAIDSERYATIRNNFVIPYEVLAQRLQSKPYFFPLRNMLCDRTEAAYKADGVHMTDYGRERIAQEMANVLKKKFPE